MSRHKTILRRWPPAMCEEEVRETFSHACHLPDGTTLRGDVAERFWYDPRIGSWYGVPPKGWDAAKAVKEAFTRAPYSEEADYS